MPPKQTPAQFEAQMVTATQEEADFARHLRKLLYQAQQNLINDHQAKQDVYPGTRTANLTIPQNSAMVAANGLLNKTQDKTPLGLKPLDHISTLPRVMDQVTTNRMHASGKFNPLESDVYKKYMNSPELTKVMSEYRDENQRHFNERVLPKLDFNYARSGAFNSNAAKVARERAALENKNNMERDIRRMYHELHKEGARLAHDTQGYEPKAIEQEMTGHLQNLNAAERYAEHDRNHQLAQDTLDRSELAQKITAQENAAKAGTALQAHEQNKLNTDYDTYMKERLFPLEVARQATDIYKGIPSTGHTVTNAFVSNPPTPPNIFNAATGVLGTFAGQSPQQIRQQSHAHGDSVTLPQAPPESHYQQLLLQQIQKLQEEEGDPRARKVAHIGNHALANITKNPLENLGEANLQHEKNEFERKKHHTERMGKAGDLLKHLEDSRARQQEMLVDMGYKKEYLGIQRDTLAETRRHHGATESEKQNKLTPQEMKHENELDSKLDASISAYRRLNEMERLQPEINTGTMAYLPSLVHDNLPEWLGGTGGAQYEYEKEAEKYAQDRAKSIGGSRVTNFELRSAKKSTPTAENSRSGIKRATTSEKEALQHTIRSLMAKKKMPYMGDIDDIEGDFSSKSSASPTPASENAYMPAQPTNPSENAHMADQSNNPYASLSREQRQAEIAARKAKLGRS